jgi:hypothetical protein
LPIDGVMLEPPALSTLVIVRLAGRAILSTSVALLAVPTGGVTVAVLVNVPVAVGLTVPVTTYVIELPAGSVTVLAMLPVPVANSRWRHPCVAVQVSLIKVRRDRIGDRGPGYAGLGPYC